MAGFSTAKSQEMAECLVELEDKIAPALLEQNREVIVSERGDLTLRIEDEYTHSLGERLKRGGFPVTIVVEGKRVVTDYGERDSDILFLDPDEASVNLDAGWLPYGVNMVVFPCLKRDVMVGDWGLAMVGDRHNKVKYLAVRGTDGAEAFVIDGIGTERRWRRPNKDNVSPIIEIPIGYTQDEDSKNRQEAYYRRIEAALDNNQLRSVDCTGANSARVADGRTMVYVEGRDLPKLGSACDLVPSVIIVNAGGGRATHLDGSEVDGIVWSEKYPQGFNSDVCRDAILAATPEIHAVCSDAIKPVLGRETEYMLLRKLGLPDSKAMNVLDKVSEGHVYRHLQRAIAMYLLD